jgi:hypothetical protein
MIKFYYKCASVIKRVNSVDESGLSTSVLNALVETFKYWGKRFCLHFTLAISN